jgi:hypothetical protein
VNPQNRSVIQPEVQHSTDIMTVGRGGMVFVAGAESATATFCLRSAISKPDMSNGRHRSNKSDFGQASSGEHEGDGPFSILAQGGKAIAWKNLRVFGGI